MMILFLVYIIALIVVPLRRKTLPDLVTSGHNCRSCLYDLTGLEDSATCPECGASEARVRTETGRWELVSCQERFVYLLVMGPVWLITFVLSSEVVVWVDTVRMVRLGYNAHAARVWLGLGAGHQLADHNALTILVGVPMYILSLVAVREENRHRYLIGFALATVVWIAQLAMALVTGLPP